MKYQSSNTKLIYDIHFDEGVKKRYHCPECSLNRKKSKNKDLEFYPSNGRAYCFHCLTTFFEYKPYDKKPYTLPEWKNKTELTDKAVKWFEGRMISQKTLIKAKIYSDKEYMPQFQREEEVICFPYFRDKQLVNIKYRGPKKSFKLHSGAELILWNIDCISENDSVIICEGEIDALTYQEIGYENVLSVPNGAGNNLEYLNDYLDLFKPLKRIYISVDNDTKGIELRDELIRRLGIEKCFIINLQECKDANEFILSHSGIELSDCVKNAVQIPIKGIIKVDNLYNDLRDLFENGIQPGLKINHDEVDKFCTWELGKLAIGTGEPNSGKSEFIDYITVKLNLLHNWKCAYFTPENYPLKYHYSKLYEKLIGRQFKNFQNEVEFDMAYDYIKENYFYILNEEDLTIDFILDSAKYLVAKEGIKILVIDPYNKIDHQYQNGETETQYISKFLDKLTNFAKFYNCLVFLIAHPAKLQPGQIPNLYSISGSANFYNKADYGFTFHRIKDEQNVMTNQSQVHWQKFRFKHLGTHGISNLVYNYKNGRFETFGLQETGWDNTNWLMKSLNENYEQFNLYESNEAAPF